jgi:hypothetical protein
VPEFPHAGHRGGDRPTDAKRYGGRTRNGFGNGFSPEVRMVTTTTADGFVGWLKVGAAGRWRQVRADGTRDEVIVVLLMAAETTKGRHKDSCVLTAGRHPNDRPHRADRTSQNAPISAPVPADGGG